MTPKNTIERALQPGPDKSILARYIRFAFDGKVGVAQAQDLAQMYLAYEDYTNNPRSYDGDFQELFGSLGTKLTEGIIRYAEIADLGDADGTRAFLGGLSALEAHLEEDTPLDDALAQFGHADAPADVSHDRDDIITDEPTPPERMLGPEDGYTADEIAALEGLMAES
ncbi:MAG: hypothetical protein P8M25_16110 [Paracoccaceae bacterium]|nr:hypothetical protein [Paracoccaceae bacterium]